jgi:hypothetical protein
MKKIISIVMFLFVTSVSFSQVITFELDSTQWFKAPIETSFGSLEDLKLIEYLDIKSVKTKWVIDTKSKKVSINGTDATLIEYRQNNEEKWIYLSYLTKGGKIWKVAIYKEKDTLFDTVLITTLENMVSQLCSFGYPTNLVIP